MADFEAFHNKSPIGKEFQPGIVQSLNGFANDLMPPVQFIVSDNIVYTEQSKVKKRRFIPRCFSDPYLSKAPSDDFYHRIYVIPRSFDLGAFVTASESFHVWNAHFSPQSFTGITESVDAGTDVVGVTSGDIRAIELVPYTLEAASTGLAIFEVYHTWDFPTPATLQVTGVRVILLPNKPVGKMVEVLEWKTDTIAAYSLETRRGLMEAPRRSITSEFFLLGVEKEEFHNRIKNQSNLFTVQCAWDQYYVGEISAPVSNIPVDTTASEFIADGLIFIYDDGGGSEIVQIETVNAGSLDLKSPTVNTYAKPIIVPTFSGYIIKADIHLRKNNTYDARIEFELYDQVRPISGTYEQYKGVDVLVDRSIVDSTLKINIDQKVGRIDNGIGKVLMLPTEDRSRDLIAHQYAKNNAQDRYAMKQWFHDRYGKRRAFYKATYQNDFNLEVAIVDTDQFVDVTKSESTAPFDIQIELKDGTLIRRGVLSTSGQGLYTRLNLDATVGRAVSLSEIKMISRFDLFRQASDKVSITYENHNLSKSKIQVINV